MAVTLRLNDRGPLVQQLQNALNKQINAGLTADGHFGAKTDAAVRTFQTRNNLTADGIAGPTTLKKLGIDTAPTTTAGKLTNADFINAAKIIGCEPAMVHALGLKESHGDPFLPDGRAAALFERHQFYKRFIIPRKPGETREKLMAIRTDIAAKFPNICSPEPGGYKGKAAEYDRISLASSFSETAALESASYGQFQVMGFNAVPIGYPSVQEFERLMQQDVYQHLEAMVRFVKATPLARKGMIDKNFAQVAEGYNGKNYKINKYDTELRRLYTQVRGQYE